MSTRMMNNRNGFTLIELMIVIAIIGILAAIAIPQFAAYRQRAQDNAARHALHTLAKAQEDYYIQNEAYTGNQGNLAAATGYAVEDTMQISIRHADNDSWSATAAHVSSSNTFTYSSSEGGLQ